MSKNKKVWFNVIVALVGALSGFLYWRLIGCTTGTCPIQSVWYFSTLWGLVVGYLLSDLVVEFIWRRAAEHE